MTSLAVLRRALAATLLLVLLVASASHGAVRERVSLLDIEDEVMCPICGVSLNIADSPQAARERVFIRRLIVRGQTKPQIKRALVRQFGPGVLALPQERGFNLAVYLIPIAAVVIALAALVVLLPRWRTRRRTAGAEEPDDPPPLSDADRRRLAEDLARYDP